MGVRSLTAPGCLIYPRGDATELQGRVCGAEKRSFLAGDEAQRWRHAKIFSSLGIVQQAPAIRFVRGERLERNQPPRDVIGAFMRQKIADQVTAAAGNDPPPLFGIRFESGALKRVDLVANKARNSHWIPSLRAAIIGLAPSQWFDYCRTMKDGPNIARIAALIGDRARADALTALITGHALTATELAAIAGVTKQTMSAH